MWKKSVLGLSVLAFIKYQLTPGRVSGYFMEVKINPGTCCVFGRR
jgi:hypothetical protein